MKHPKWCGRFIKPQEIHAVSQAIRASEAETTGEIIPMIVKRSTGLGHLTMLIYALGTLSLFVTLFFIDHFTDLEVPLKVPLIGALVLYPMSEILARWPRMQRWLTLPKERNWQVQARALVEFYGSGFQNTKEHTGVLIFLSLMERKCIVLADSGIAEKLPEQTWVHMVNTITTAIQDGQPGKGLISAITECGRILKEHFPAQGQHVNQIANDLIIKD